MGDLKRKQEDFADVAERIILTLNNAFKRDANIDEFDIVPVESQSNRSPVIHEEHKLALESWCVPFLYSHSFKCFLQLMGKSHSRKGYSKSQSKEVDAVQSESCDQKSWINRDPNFKNGRYSPQSDMTETEKLMRKISLSRVLLLICPELVVAWNFRRSCVQMGSLDWKNELKLSNLVLTRKPKSSEIFAYKKWLLLTFAFENYTDERDLHELVIEELGVCSVAADTYFSNYHAWSHRQWTVSSYLKVFVADTEKQLQLLETELRNSDKWIEKHVSDHSGFHYRQYLLKSYVGVQARLGNFSTPKLVNDELLTNETFIKRYPGHQTLWYYRRFLIAFAAEQIYCKTRVVHESKLEGGSDTFPSKSQDVLRDKNDSQNSEAYLVNCIEAELSEKTVNATKLPKINFITKESLELNLLYAQQHCKWLNAILGWEITQPS